MKIASIQFSLQTNSLEIYLSGCYGNCKGCHNPEIKSFKIGEEYTTKLEEIKKKIKNFDKLIQNIWVLGGEPLDQNQDSLLHLLMFLNSFNKPIWLFTRYKINEISEDIKLFVDYIKTGKYDESQKIDNYYQYGVQLATSNQKIWKKEGDIFV